MHRSNGSRFSKSEQTLPSFKRRLTSYPDAQTKVSFRRLKNNAFSSISPICKANNLQEPRLSVKSMNNGPQTQANERNRRQCRFKSTIRRRRRKAAKTKGVASKTKTKLLSQLTRYRQCRLGASKESQPPRHHTNFRLSPTSTRALTLTEACICRTAKTLSQARKALRRMRAS